MIQTPKTDWTASDGLPDDALNRIELNIKLIREEVTLPLRVEVLTGFPSHAVGRLFYHSGDKRMYVSTGTEWV